MSLSLDAVRPLKLASRLRLAAVRAGLLTLCSLSSCGLGPTPNADGGRGLLVIAIDGLRADHLSCYGYDRETTPRLDGLVAEGVLFRHAFSAAPLRVPAHCALLSGSDPNLARRQVPQWLEATLDQTWLLPAAVPRLPLELAELGFETVAFSSHPEFSRVFGLGVGFQGFVAPWEQHGQPVAAGELLSQANQWILGRQPNADWFCYLELNDLELALNQPSPSASTHFAPRESLNYLPPIGTERPTLFALPPERFDGALRSVGEFEARYDGTLFELDQALGQWLDELDAAGRLSRTTVCVVGSYGMQFGEAGLIADHGRLSMADLAVPVLLLPAAELAVQRRGPRDELFSTLDLAPSLLGLYGGSAPASMVGQDRLAPGAKAREYCFASCAIQGGYAAISEDLCLELTFGGAVASEALTRAWFGDLHKHVGAVSERLYEWRQQRFPPLSASPISDPSRAGPLRAAAASYIESIEKLRERYQEPLLRLGFRDRDALEGAPP